MGRAKAISKTVGQVLSYLAGYALLFGVMPMLVIWAITAIASIPNHLEKRRQEAKVAAQWNEPDPCRVHLLEVTKKRFPSLAALDLRHLEESQSFYSSFSGPSYYDLLGDVAAGRLSRSEFDAEMRRREKDRMQLLARQQKERDEVCANLRRR